MMFNKDPFNVFERFGVKRVFIMFIFYDCIYTTFLTFRANHTTYVSRIGLLMILLHELFSIDNYDRENDPLLVPCSLEVTQDPRDPI